MWDLLIQTENRWFAVALAVMLMLGILEVISLLVGGISDWLDHLLPQNLLDHASPELSLDATSGSAFVEFLAWLYLGRVPVLMWLVVFLATYSITGFILQSLWFWSFASYLPAWLAGIAVFFIILPLVRYIAMGLYQVLPKDFSTAIHSEALIGSAAQIVLGEARQGYPAQAKLKDVHGQIHYVMVEPDLEQTLPQGSEILLVSKHGTVFKAIPKE